MISTTMLCQKMSHFITSSKLMMFTIKNISIINYKSTYSSNV